LGELSVVGDGANDEPAERSMFEARGDEGLVSAMENDAEFLMLLEYDENTADGEVAIDGKVSSLEVEWGKTVIVFANDDELSVLITDAGCKLLLLLSVARLESDTNDVLAVAVTAVLTDACEVSIPDGDITVDVVATTDDGLGLVSPAAMNEVFTLDDTEVPVSDDVMLVAATEVGD